MKRILMLATGGTIASKSTDSGLTPMLTSEDILKYIPKIKTFCEVETAEVFSIDSTDITPSHWLRIASEIEKNYSDFDGFVICHGTDTMAYTAAALSYLIQNSPKPIVLTGSQKPIDIDGSDAKTNLFDSFLYAATCVGGGVQIVFGGKVIIGTRARKTNSKSFQAFSSINYPELAVIRDGRVMQFIRQPYESSEVHFYRKLNDKVALMKLTPGAKADVLEYLLSRNDAVIIESFGVGGLPSSEGAGFTSTVDKWTRQGKTIVMTTQVPNEGSDIIVYKVGYSLKQQSNVLEAYDMTTEAALAKLMWLLGEKSATADGFYEPVSSDILYTDKNLSRSF